MAQKTKASALQASGPKKYVVAFSILLDGKAPIYATGTVYSFCKCKKM
jgi:hypothetical protein